MTNRIEAYQLRVQAFEALKSGVIVCVWLMILYWKFIRTPYPINVSA